MYKIKVTPEDIFRGLFKGRISIYLSLVCGQSASSKEGVPLIIYNMPMF